MRRVVLLSSSIALAACGSAISLGGPGDGGGGAGGSSQGGGGTAGGSNPCEPVQACNSPECPDGPPALYELCPDEGLSCQYDTGDCLLSFSCEVIGVCAPPPDGGDEPPEPCPDTAWIAGPAECDGGVVECEVAMEGQPCAYPGESCGVGFECEWQETVCGPDHLWHVQGFVDECCFEPCCEPFVCPPLPPQAGEPCEPCIEGPACDYEIDTMCGPAPVSAFCDEPSLTWEVVLPPPCP